MGVHDGNYFLYLVDVATIKAFLELTCVLVWVKYFFYWLHSDKCVKRHKYFMSSEKHHCVHHHFYHQASLVSFFPAPLWTELAYLTVSSHSFSWYTLLAVCPNWRINNITKYADFDSSVGRLVKSSSLDGGGEGEYNIVGFIETSKIELFNRP